MLNRRAQEAAPFELLIAVIVMGFVIYVGLRAMSDLRYAKCNNEIDAGLENMITKIQGVVGGSKQTINFVLSDCYNPLDEEVRVIEKDDAEECAAHCGVSMPVCLLLRYFNTAPGGFSTVKCINVDPGIVFPSVTGGKCEDRETNGFELVDFRYDTEGVRQGFYELIDKTSINDSYPTVCAYRRAN